MKPSLIATLLAPLAFAACASAPAPVLAPVAPPVVQAPPPPPAPGAVARAACEAAATPMVRRMVRGATEVTYNDPQLGVVSPTATSLRGNGQFTRASGPANFAYRCTFNPRTGAASAVRVTRR